MTTSLRLFPTNPKRTSAIGGALAVTAAVVLSGCLGSSDSQEVANVASMAAPGQGVADVAAESAVADSPARAAVTTSVPKLAKLATISLEVPDLAGAAARARSIAATQGGIVLKESLGSGATAEASPEVPFGGYGTMTISVPAAALDLTMTELAKSGTVLARGSSTTDVTSEVVDTDSRLANMRASVGRIRTLMARAQDVGDVVALESELSRRQADLDSLASQQKALAGRVEQASVVLTLSTPAAAADVRADDGFTGGLRSGWSAFRSTVRGLLTGAGAVLPFAVVVGVVGVPLVVWVRRRAGRSGVRS